MSETKPFPLRVVLTVSTGRLLTEGRGEHDNGIGDLYEILNWMTGDNLFTHQLPRAGDACKPVLLAAFPELQAVNAALPNLDAWLAQYVDAPERSDREKGGAEDAIQMWLAEIQLLFPELKAFYDVPTLAEWTSIHPMIELESMVSKDKIIAVQV